MAEDLPDKLLAAAGDSLGVSGYSDLSRADFLFHAVFAKYEHE